MGIKDLFIVSEKPSQPRLATENFPMPEVVAIVAKGDANEPTTIQEIYEQANLADFSRSVFKVEDFAKTVPENLPAETRKQIIIGTMTAAGFSVGELNQDFGGRIAALLATTQAIAQRTISIVEENDQKIADLQTQIDALKQATADRQAFQSEMEKLIKGEDTKITGIISLIK